MTDEELEQKIAAELWWWTPEGRAEVARIDAEIEAHLKEMAAVDAEFEARFKALKEKIMTETEALVRQMCQLFLQRNIRFVLDTDTGLVPLIPRGYDGQELVFTREGDGPSIDELCA